MSWNVIASLAGPVVQGGLDYLQGKKNREAAQDANAANIATQKEFAQNGIRWKVEDAKAAGIHPLAALGANTMSFSPSVVGAPDTTAGTFGEMGQNISRAISATRTEEERTLAKIQLAQAESNLEGSQIENMIKLSQLQKLSPGNPAFAGSTNFMPGQGDSGLVTVKPKERVVSQPGAPHQEAGWVPDLGFARTATGLTPVVPESLSESLEDDVIGKLLWRLRNQVMPNVSPGGLAPPKNMLPEGYSHWEWSVKQQEWQPRKEKIRTPLLKKWPGFGHKWIERR